VQTFKQALKKLAKAPKRCAAGRPEKLPAHSFINRVLAKIRTKIDTLLPSPAHTAQGKQPKEATKSQQSPLTYEVGDPCYALYFGPRRDRDTRWVSAIVVKRFGTRSVNVHVVLRGPVWRRHIDQLQRRYVWPDDTEPGDTPRLSESREENPSVSEQLSSDISIATTRKPPTSQYVSAEYRPSHPRRSKRPRTSYFFVIKLAIFYFTREVLRVVFLELSLVPVCHEFRGADCK